MREEQGDDPATRLAKLERAVGHFQALAEASGHVLWMVDPATSSPTYLGGAGGPATTVGAVCDLELTPASQARFRAWARELLDPATPAVRTALFEQVEAGAGPRYIECTMIRVAADAGVELLGYSWDATARVNAEAALRDSEQRLRRAINLAPFPVMIHAEDGQVLELSRAWTEVTGYTLEDIPTVEAWARKAYGDGWHEIARMFSALYDRDRPISGLERTVTAKDGSSRTLLFGAAGLGYGSGHRIGISMAVDLTDRKRMEEKLARYQLLARHSRDAIVFVHVPSGRILEANAAAQAMYGYTLEELVALTVYDLRLPAEHAEVKRQLEANDSVGMVVEAVHRRKDGSTFPVEFGAKRVEGQSTRISVIRDVSERRRHEEQRRRLEKELVQAQKMESVGRLAGGLAHDFNNLLTVILGCVDLHVARTRSGRPSRVDEIAQIRAAAERAAEVTSRLLTFARKQPGRDAVVDIGGLVEGAVSLLRRTIGEDLDLRLLVAPGLWSVRADPGQLEQVLLNLAINARDAMPQGGVLTIQVRNVTVGASDVAAREDLLEGDWVQLTVLDTGTGMSPEVQAHLFEPFFTTKPPGKGTGLGLATVYGIVKQAGGHMHVESDLGRGSAFSVCLPRLTVAETTVVAPAPRTREAAPVGQPDATILVVEDDVAVRAVTVRILADAGYRVLEAGSAAEALAVAAGAEELDLVVSDVVMPGDSGPTAVEALRRARPTLRAIFVSGYTEGVVARVKVSRSFLAKPFSAESLLERVRDVLGSPPT